LPVLLLTSVSGRETDSSHKIFVRIFVLKIS